MKVGEPIPPAVQRMFDDILGRMERSYQRQEIEDIRKDPDKHRLTRLMAPGKRASYRYFRTKKKGVRWCYLVSQNAAGYYLSFRETVTKHRVERDQFCAWKSKKSAVSSAKRNAEAV